MTQIDEIITKLKDTPLFYLFLSSRELFHTNFWFWLSTINKIETLKLFTEKSCNNKSLFFKREHNQASADDKSKVDMLISCDNKPFVVIENKVKDFPTNGQLQRIKNSFNDESFEYILVTLFSSPDIVFEDWKIKTYRNVSEVISPENFTDNEYHKNLIQDYKEFISNLSELAESLPLTQEYDFANSYNAELFHKLNEIKLWESYQKLRASHFLHHFGNRENVFTSHSVNNQKATITLFTELKDDYQIGIEIEDKQFRKFVRGKKAETFAQNLLSSRIFFDEEFKGRGNKPFLKYGSVFRYQYKKIDNKTSFQSLFNDIHFVLSEIEKQKCEIEDEIPNH